MNRRRLLARLAAIQDLTTSVWADQIPEHTKRKLWHAMNDVADARTVLSLEQQAKEREIAAVGAGGEGGGVLRAGL